MTSTLDRADELAAVLAGRGVRVVVGDTDTIAAPVVLLIPPGRRFDLSCGCTARWSAHALAPAGPNGTGNRDSWATLDVLVETCVDVWPVETADLTTYVVGNTSYPSYSLTWEEALA